MTKMWAVMEILKANGVMNKGQLKKAGVDMKVIEILIEDGLISVTHERKAVNHCLSYKAQDLMKEA